MKISIITVSYNSEETIEDTIRSVLSQSYRNIEYILVDGNSSDRTMSIVKKYEANIAKVISEEDKGIYDAMNKGIGMASGDIIGTLNADDVYADNFVLERVAETMRHKELDVCYGNLVYVAKNDLNQIVRWWESCPYKKSLCINKSWVPPHPTFFVRKEVYEKYGRFDLSYKFVADYDLMLRFLYQHNLRSEHISQVLVKMRLGGLTNKTMINVIKQNLEISRIRKKNGLRSGLTFICHKIINRVGQFRMRDKT